LQKDNILLLMQQQMDVSSFNSLAKKKMKLEATQKL
jgi:hypothetical protein